MTLPQRVTMENVKSLERQLEELLYDKTTMVLCNCSLLEYLDSSGIGMMVKVLTAQSDHQPRLCFYHMKMEIREIFKLAKLDRFFSIMSDVEARQFLQTHASAIDQPAPDLVPYR